MSPAERYTLALFRRAWKQNETQTNLDPSDDTRLRELLEERVKEKAGTLDLDLSDGWVLVVKRGVRVVARVWVDKSGRTEVTR